MAVVQRVSKVTVTMRDDTGGERELTIGPATMTARAILEDLPPKDGWRQQRTIGRRYTFDVLDHPKEHEPGSIVGHVESESA